MRCEFTSTYTYMHCVRSGGASGATDTIAECEPDELSCAWPILLRALHTRGSADMQRSIPLHSSRVYCMLECTGCRAKVDVIPWSGSPEVCITFALLKLHTLIPNIHEHDSIYIYEIMLRLTC